MAHAPRATRIIDRARRGRRRWRGALALAIVLISGAGVLGTGAAPTNEQVVEAKVTEVMATFLLKLTKFVRWPEESFADKDAPFVIGVLGEDPFRTILDSAVYEQTVSGRAVHVKRLPAFLDAAENAEAFAALTDELKRCHMLFVCGSEKRAMSRILETCGRRPILTVSDIRGFARQGGMIEFVITIAARVFEGIEFASEDLGPNCVKVIMIHSAYPTEHFRGIFQEWMEQYGHHGSVMSSEPEANVCEYVIRWD